MAKIPVKFKRVAAAFDEYREGSGSDHSAESLTDLSDLVNSFLERDIEVDFRDVDDVVVVVDDDDRGNDDHSSKSDESERNCSDYKSKDLLRNLLACHDDDMKRKIHAEVEKAFKEVGDFLSPDFKRRLMSRLRQRGFDAGLCKSKWEKNGNCPAGEYEYIDVFGVVGGRYIVEISLAKEFEIARATACYEALLQTFPPIFVGRKDELKQIVKIMCNTIRRSMQSNALFLPPWRRHSYVQAKWFSSYRRTINEVPAKKDLNFEETSRKKKSIGFVPVPRSVPYSYICKEDYAAKFGSRVGNLAAALNNSSSVVL